MKKLKSHEVAENEKVETIQESMKQSDKLFYEYLNDMRLDEDCDYRDYCAAFMFA